MKKNIGLNCIVLMCVVVILLGGLQNTFAQSDSVKVSKQKKDKLSFRDPEDGALDLSSFLLDHHGFLPMPMFITEPAVGYGGGAALMFFHKQKKKRKRWVPPSITGVVGLGTQNKTWVAGLFHFHVFGDDKVRYVGAIGKPMIHIKYYGNNNDFLSQHPVQLKMDAFALAQRVQYRIGETDFFAGLSYVLFTTKNSIDSIAGRPLINKILERLGGKSTISMIEPSINYDTRNNIFSPTKGTMIGLKYFYNATWLGADDKFSKINSYYYGYLPIGSSVFSGFRMDANFTLGDAPLYALPFIELRGVPLMRYQSDNTLLIETDWRFATRKRWSFNVFAGTGKAFPDFSEMSSSKLVCNYGLGFRYQIARAFGMETGVDFAWSNDGDFAFYIIMGSPWNK